MPGGSYTHCRLNTFTLRTLIASPFPSPNRVPVSVPDGSEPEALAATGTDGRPISKDFPLILPYTGDAEGRSGTVTGEMNQWDGPTSEMRLSLKKKALDEPRRVWAGLRDKEAPPGFEPGMKVLQTSGQRDVKPKILHIL